MSTAMPIMSVTVSIPLEKPTAVSMIPTAISKRNTMPSATSKVTSTAILIYLLQCLQKYLQ